MDERERSSSRPISLSATAEVASLATYGSEGMSGRKDECSSRSRGRSFGGILRNEDDKRADSEIRNG